MGDIAKAACGLRPWACSRINQESLVCSGDVTKGKVQRGVVLLFYKCGRREVMVKPVAIILDDLRERFIAAAKHALSQSWTPSSA